MRQGLCGQVIIVLAGVARMSLRSISDVRCSGARAIQGCCAARARAPSEMGSNLRSDENSHDFFQVKYLSQCYYHLKPTLCLERHSRSAGSALSKETMMKQFLFATTFALLAFSAIPLEAQAAPLFGHPSAAGGSWSTTGSLRTSRVLPMAATLPNGNVLAAGGFNASATLASAEIFNPTTGLW